MIERHEGRENKPYRCTAGKLTIGVGHNLDDKPLSDKAVDQILDDDITDAIRDCASLYPNWNQIPEDIQMVLIDMMFNLGRTRLSKFRKMNRAVEDFNWGRMVAEMQDSRWYKQVGNRSKELEEIVIQAANS